MRILYCWRCKMDVPMFDEDEYEIAKMLYSKGIKNLKVQPAIGRFKELLDYYNELSGFGETEPNAIMHHNVMQYGPPCEICGKPYRTPLAKLCAACGHKRNE